MIQRLSRVYFTHFPIESGKWGIWKIIRPYLGAETSKPFVKKTKYGMRIYVTPNQYIDNFINYWGIWEPNETWAIRRLLRTGDVFVDVGANIGWFTLVASRAVGPGGHVIAIEATPSTCEILRANIALNGLGNVTIHPCAVSDRDGTVQINQIYDRNIGMNSMRSGAGRESVGAGWSVPARRLDDLLAVWPKVSLVKLDIEGAEGLALQGMREMISRPDGPNVLCEITGPYLREIGSEPAEIFNLFAVAGYKPFRLDNRRFTRTTQDEIPDGSSVNVLFTKGMDR